MKTDHSFKFVAAALLAGVILAFVNPADAAERAPKQTRTKTRSGTYETSSGNSGTFASNTSRGRGEFHRDNTRTNQDGQTSTRSLDRTFDQATGTGNVTAAATRPSGDTTSRQGTLVKNADGSMSTAGTITGPNGKISTYSGTALKTETGSSASGTITGPGGNVGSYSREFTQVAPGQTSRTSTVTGPNGKTTETIASTSLNGDGTGTRVIAVTKPDGTTETRTETFTLTSATPAP
jgi:hypothetical protein